MKIKKLRLFALGALPVVLLIVIFRVYSQRPQALPIELSYGEFILTPDEGYLALSSNWIGELRWYDFKTGKVQSVHPSETNGGDIGATNIAALPNSQIIAGVHFDNIQDFSSIALYDLQNPKNFRVIANRQVASPALAVSPKTSEIAVFNAQGELCFWNPKDGRLLRKWRGFLGKLRQSEIKAVRKNVPIVLSYSPDGKTIALGGWYYMGNSVIDAGTTTDAALWNVATGRKICDLPLPNVRSLTGNNSAGGSGWYNANTTSLVFSPNGRWLANDSNGDGVVIWNVATGAIYKLLEHPVNHEGFAINHLYGGGGVAFSPDSKYIVAPGDTGKIDVWDVQSGSLIKQLTGSGPVVFLSNSSQLISGGVHSRGNLLKWPNWH